MNYRRLTRPGPWQSPKPQPQPKPQAAISFRDMTEKDMLLAIQQLRAELLGKLDRDLAYMQRRQKRNEKKTNVDIDLERDTKLFQRLATLLLEILEEYQERPVEIHAARGGREI